jgi:hypothetical protein
MRLLLSLFISIYLTAAYASDSSIRTAIYIFSPWQSQPKQQLSSGLTVKARGLGSCWTGSMANPRPDAWRCMLGNQLFDPCFSQGITAEKGDLVACIASPWQKQLTVITLTSALTKQNPNRDRYLEQTPWAIVLNNGYHCIYDHTGTVYSVANLVQNASCQDQGLKSLTAFTAFKQIDRHLPRWFVFIQQQPRQIQQMAINEAWY